MTQIKKVLAFTKDGTLTYCSASEENRGKGRCNHIVHAEENESPESFINRISNLMKSSETKEEEIEENPITKNEIDVFKSKILEIMGKDKSEVNLDNLSKEISKLPPEKQQEIVNIGYEAAQYFSFPITREEYEEEDFKTNIYFSNMNKYGLGAKENHLNELFNTIGDIVKIDGKGHIDNNYFNGLTDEQYWSLQYATRVASINKVVSVSAPGHIARSLYYGLSDTIIIDDCHSHDSEGILTCDAPGGFCEKCAAKSKMKNILNILKKDSDVGTLRIGGLVSSNLSEPLTQSYLNAIHSANSSKTSDHELIVKTFQGHTMSPIIKAANEGKTTMEKRKILYNGLKQAYKDQGIKIDDWNIMVAAKKMTSYKYDEGRLKFVEPDEDCNIVSMNCIGNQTNIFKKASLGQSFDTLSKGGEYYKNPFDSFNDLMGNLD